MSTIALPVLCTGELKTTSSHSLECLHITKLNIQGLRKPILGSFKEVRHKPAGADTQESQTLDISVLETIILSR